LARSSTGGITAVSPGTWEARGSITATGPIALSGGGATTFSVKADSPVEDNSGNVLLQCSSPAEEINAGTAIGTLSITGEDVTVNCVIDGAAAAVSILGDGDVTIQEAITCSGALTLNADEDCSGAGDLTGTHSVVGGRCWVGRGKGRLCWGSLCSCCLVVLVPFVPLFPALSCFLFYGSFSCGGGGGCWCF